MLLWINMKHYSFCSFSWSVIPIFSTDLFAVYLQTKPEVVLERVKKRLRPEEQEIPLVSVVKHIQSNLLMCSPLLRGHLP